MKKLLSILFTAIFIFSLIPSTVSAETIKVSDQEFNASAKLKEMTINSLFDELDEISNTILLDKNATNEQLKKHTNQIKSINANLSSLGVEKLTTSEIKSFLSNCSYDEILKLSKNYQGDLTGYLQWYTYTLQVSYNGVLYDIKKMRVSSTLDEDNYLNSEFIRTTICSSTNIPSTQTDLATLYIPSTGFAKKLGSVTRDDLNIPKNVQLSNAKIILNHRYETTLSFIFVKKSYTTQSFSETPTFTSSKQKFILDLDVSYLLNGISNIKNGEKIFSAATYNYESVDAAISYYPYTQRSEHINNYYISGLNSSNKSSFLIKIPSNTPGGIVNWYGFN